MKRWGLRLLVVSLIAAAAWVAKQTVLAPKPVEVSVYEVSRGRVESTVTNTRAGTIQARRRAALSAQVGGLVLELPHAEGDRVEKDALLLQLDLGVQLAQKELAQRQLESAVARQAEAASLAERAQRELERNQKLFEENFISADVIDELATQRDQARLGVLTAEAMVSEARAQLGLVEARIAQGELRAPFAGIIAKLSVELGEFVTPSPPGLPIPAVIDLIDPSSIYIQAPMDEVDSALIAVDMNAKITIDPYPDQVFIGRVHRIAPYVLDVKEQNRTLDIEVELQDRELARRLLPGTSADVEVILEVAEGVVRIPTSALLQGGRVLVFEDGLLVQREVEIGLRNWNWTSILSGLEEGELVVTSLGSKDVRDGALAELAEARHP